MNITIHLNGVNREVATTPGELLSDLLRRIGLTGVKKGCGEGTCGSCTILLNGRPVNSCLILAARVDGHAVTTIEGLANPDQPHPLQESYVKHGAVQCGFCTPGSILAASALLAENPHPDVETIKRALDGNLCRCTGFKKKIDAVLDAAAAMSGEAGKRS